MIAQLIDTGETTINGHHLTELPMRQRRGLAGVASAHEIRQVHTQVGLAPRISADAHGLKRQLKNDGKPWGTADIERLQLARALLREPPLLIAEDPTIPVSADYPGVVITTGPYGTEGATGTWNLEGVIV